MNLKLHFPTTGIFLLTAVLVLSGCGLLVQPVTRSGTAPTPVVSFEKGGVDNPDVYVDAEAFQTALLHALVSRDTEKLKMWMTEPFLTGTWRADLSDTSPADAIQVLTEYELPADNRLTLVKNADLKALLGGKDPLSIPGGESGVEKAFLVSGWGKDGRDEVILFLARQADNSVKWHGWMVIKGGFSGARLGGSQPYTNNAHGYSLFIPKDFETSDANANEVLVLGPGEGHPTDNRVGIFISVEPANGRTAEQIATQLAEKTKVEMGAGYTGAEVTAMGIESEPAFSVGGLPGQDVNRQVFIVHNDLLYKMMFVPDSPRASAYPQMEDAYAMIINTFHFTK